MNSIEEIKSYLQLKYNLVLFLRGQQEKLLEIKEPITKWEADAFLKGLEKELFIIDDYGYVQTDLLPQPPENSNKQKMIQLFWSQGSGKITLFREGINQLATASRLIYELGWSKQDIKMEPSVKEYGDCAYGVDIIFPDENNKIPYCCENKRSSKELDKLIKQFMYCCDLGSHEKDKCKHKENHGKYRFCDIAKPKYFLMISPDKEVLFQLSYKENGVIKLKELPSILSKKEIISGSYC